MLAKMFYNISNFLNCKDLTVGRLIKDLINEDNYNLPSVFKKYDILILEENIMFYLELGH